MLDLRHLLCWASADSILPAWPRTHAYICCVDSRIVLAHVFHGPVFQVGIIMYLPTADPRQRKQITEEFFHYRFLTQTHLWDLYSAYEHWAKIEVFDACSTLRLEYPLT